MGSRVEEDGMPVWLVGGRSLRLARIAPCGGVRLSEPDSAISVIEKLSINSARRGDHNSTKIAIANARLVVRFEVAQIAGGNPASTTRKSYSAKKPPKKNQYSYSLRKLQCGVAK